MKIFLLIAILIARVPSALAGELQFGLIYPSDFKAERPLQPGNGWSLGTFVVVNLGTTNINLNELSFTSSIVSTTTSVNPAVDMRFSKSSLPVLSPGHAYGYINNGFNQPLTLAYLQSIFPTTTNLIIDAANGLNADFTNPLGSGAVFQNSETLVDYQMSIDGATAAWRTSWEMGSPLVPPFETQGTVGHTLSNRVTVGTGEIFKIETTGTEYCGDFDFTKFNASSNVDLWVRLDSNTQLTVSLTSNFLSGTTFPMTGFFYLTKTKTASFVGGVLFVDFSYATILGTATFNKLGEVTKLQGTFIQKEVLRVGCFSSGTFKSVQKLN